MIVEELIKKIKHEAKSRSKNETAHLDNIEEEKSFSTYETQNMQETFLFRYAKSIGKYLQKKGLRGFVNFVRRNINLQQFSNSFEIEDFTKYNDESFIDNAYKNILNREADADGKKNYLSKLRDGELSKVEIITMLHFSQEGKTQEITIKSAKIQYLLMQSSKVPVLGYLIKSIVALVTLPNILKKIQKNENTIELKSTELLKKYTELNQKQKTENRKHTQYLKELESSLTEQLLHLEKFLSTKVDNEKFEIYLKLINSAKNNLERLVDAAKKRLPEKKFTSMEHNSIIEEENHFFDALYLSFENEFRGSKKDIKDKVEVYLPYLESLSVNKDEINILDVGCGRGEWLELLKDNGYIHTAGIDLNRIMVSVAQETNLNVKESDVIEYLKSLEDESLSVITGFHIIEHLPFPVLMKLFEESFRVLKKEGMIIFETPNPRNILVGSSDFYLDPTHINPIHPLTLKFLVQYIGFSNVDSFILDENKLVNFDELKFSDINDYIKIGRDLSVIAYK